MARLVDFWLKTWNKFFLFPLPPSELQKLILKKKSAEDNKSMKN